MFSPATEKQLRLRLALDGPSGSGKTFTALTFGFALGKKVAVLDTERGSAAKYRNTFPQFDHCDLKSFDPREYIKAIEFVNANNYDVLIIDSLSHAWIGALELVDKKAKASQSGNSFAAWRDVTPLHNQLVDAILNCKAHVIATMRVKSEWVIQENDRGKKVPQKIGMAPVQRDGVEYEFDIVADMTLEHDLIVGKTRCSTLDGVVVRCPGASFLEPIMQWLGSGVGSEAKKEAPKSEPAKDSVATKTPAESPAPATASATNSKANATGGEDPKSVKDADAPSETTTTQTDRSTSASTQNAQDSTGAMTTAVTPATAAQTNKVGGEQMQQLLDAGTANGWTRQQISAFVCDSFKLTPATISQLPWKQWEIAVKVVSLKDNANGKVTHNSSGQPLPAEHHWPKAAA